MDVVARLDAGERRGAQRQHFGDAQPAVAARSRARSKRTPSRPTFGCGEKLGPLTPECDAFSSPTMRRMMRRSSSVLCAPAAYGS